MGKGEMGDGVTVPVGGEVCKNVRGEWHRVNGRIGNGVSVPVGGEVCKNVRGEWHRVNGIIGNGVTVPVGGEVCKNVRGEWHSVNDKKYETVLLRHYRSGGLVSGGCPRAAFL